jgi:F-type H+-transporting ATPase subunit b
MQDTLRELLNLLIAAVPTMLLLAFLTVYLNVMLFRPIARIQEERKKATGGARELAQRAYEAAQKKNSEYVSALEAARAQIRKEQEWLRHQWAGEQSAALEKVSGECETQIKDARQEMLLQVEQQKANCQEVAESLSQYVVETLLQRRAA